MANANMMLTSLDNLKKLTYHQRSQFLTAALFYCSLLLASICQVRSQMKTYEKMSKIFIKLCNTSSINRLCFKK